MSVSVKIKFVFRYVFLIIVRQDTLHISKLFQIFLGYVFYLLEIAKI